MSMPPVGSGLELATVGWSADADEWLVCQAVLDETPDVKTFVLKPLEGRRFSYQPGQFMTYEFTIGGETFHRCYTISTAPTRPDTLSLTVKRVPNGPVSNWLHDTVKPGTRFKALGPMGDFSCFTYPARKYLFLSGGSGITPLMSMARTFYDLADQRDIVFVHNARSPLDVIFADELNLMARHNRQFRFLPMVEAASPLVGWSGLTGRIGKDVLLALVPDLMEREIFVCGPSPYMAAVRTLLGEVGFPMEHHHEESFNFDELPRAEQAEVLLGEAALEAAPEIKTYRVEFSRTRRAIDCPADTTVLEAAKRAGMRLPSSCTQGLCGTCKSKKLSGTVAMTHQGGIRQREIDAGMVLLCCSRPTSDLVIER